jgi:hypothetical protein
VSFMYGQILGVESGVSCNVSTHVCSSMQLAQQVEAELNCRFL